MLGGDGGDDAPRTVTDETFAGADEDEDGVDDRSC